LKSFRLESYLNASVERYNACLSVLEIKASPAKCHSECYTGELKHARTTVIIDENGGVNFHPCFWYKYIVGGVLYCKVAYLLVDRQF
jgi:hypothetical protein